MPGNKVHRVAIEPFRWEADDPLAVEHQWVADLVSETLKSGWNYASEFNFDRTATGRKIQAAGPDASARLVLALGAHASHFDELGKQVRALATNKMEQANWHLSPEWDSIWPVRQVSAQALRRLMRRKLPLNREHLIKLADWIASADWHSDPYYPLKAFVKAVEAHGEVASSDDALRASLSRVVKALREDHSKEAPKSALIIDNLLGGSEGKSVPSVHRKNSALDASQPAPVGSPQVLVQLKQLLGVFPDSPDVSTDIIGLDRFPLRADSSLRAEHEWLNMFLPEVVGTVDYYRPVLEKTEAGRAILAKDSTAKGRLLLAAAERVASRLLGQGADAWNDHRVWQSFYAVNGVFRELLHSEPDFDRDGAFDALLFLTAITHGYEAIASDAVERLARKAAGPAAASGLTAGERHVLYRLRSRAVRTAPFGRPSQEVTEITRVLGDDAFLVLVPGEAWSDALNADLGKLSPTSRQHWVALLQHAATATGSRPSAKWLKTAKEKLKAIGAKAFSEALRRWFPLVSAPGTITLLGAEFGGRSGLAGTIHENNATCLRGLLWLAPEVVSPDLLRAIGALTVSCYRKIPGVGPRAVKVANAGVYALSQINDPLAVGQLALLKVKVKFGSAQKEIEKAFTLAAERSGLPREELEEMSIPTHGLTEVGVGEEKMGEFTARLTITGTDSTELVWIKPDAKTQRGVPAEVKASHADDLKELQASAKDIQKMLPAQRERIDSLFLQQRVWPWHVWRERYLNHPLIGTLARRILWEFTDKSRTTTGIWFNGRLVDIDLKPVEVSDPKVTVRLWHPIGKNPDEVAAWRSWLEAQQIQQPFKQAHREIYLLTEAEQRTRTYSNRYAAHVLKQHQFNALCALRGWKNQLRLMVDAEYLPPSLKLPQWGLRAEFWVEGIGQDYGADTNDSGVYLRLSTDQVRFYRMDDAQRAAHAGGGGYRPGHRADAEPMPLEEIPPLVFSEVMRDVDLFVGVASVGNDPAWADGGPQGRYRDYWQNYSFGELNGTAKTRQDVLQRLVPKLKIANVCRFEERFLIVKGSLRTYKIHLGSGNILMEPNDQYLCIVPKQGDAQDSPVLLPFEGDRTLAVILSKAFLLANDAKITDSSIVSQIKR